MLQPHWESAAWAERGAGFQGEEPTRLQRDISELFNLLPCINNFSSVPSRSQPSLTALVREVLMNETEARCGDNAAVKLIASRAPHSPLGAGAELAALNDGQAAQM